MPDKKITDLNAMSSVDGSADMLEIVDVSDNESKRTSRNTLLGITSQPLGLTDSQSPTNKILDNTNTLSLRDDRFTLQDNGDVTKQARFELSGITTATTRIYTLPNANDTLVGIAATQTLTNKTLTSPSINTPTITNPNLQTNTISEFTAANGVTVDGLNIKDGALNTNNSVVTANITDAAVTPAKLIAGSGTGWTYQTWTPTWTNFSIGNGTISAKYQQTGKNVKFIIEVLFGSTTTIGTSPTFTLPNTSVSYVSNLTALGISEILDNGTAFIQGSTIWVSTTTGKFVANKVDGVYAIFADITATIPMTWTTADRFSIWGEYEAA